MGLYIMLVFSVLSLFADEIIIIISSSNNNNNISSSSGRSDGDGDGNNLLWCDCHLFLGSFSACVSDPDAVAVSEWIHHERTM